MYTPPSSPPLTTTFDDDYDSYRHQLGRDEGATYTITEECERLFCDSMRALFLGEGRLAHKGSLGMGMDYKNTLNRARMGNKVIIRDWLEIWDYVGGTCFRGFVAEKDHQKSMFVFFEAPSMEQDLKPGLMSIIDLASSPDFDCSALVVCLDRDIGSKSLPALIRDLGWVGFNLMTLEAVAGGGGKGFPTLSSKWVFVTMEL
jgi:hypothetical protein